MRFKVKHSLPWSNNNKSKILVPKLINWCLTRLHHHHLHLATSWRWVRKSKLNETRRSEFTILIWLFDKWILFHFLTGIKVRKKQNHQNVWSSCLLFFFFSFIFSFISLHLIRETPLKDENMLLCLSLSFSRTYCVIDKHKCFSSSFHQQQLTDDLHVYCFNCYFYAHSYIFHLYTETEYLSYSFSSLLLCFYFLYMYIIIFYVYSCIFLFCNPLCDTLCTINLTAHQVTLKKCVSY